MKRIYPLFLLAVLAAAAIRVVAGPILPATTIDIPTLTVNSVATETPDSIRITTYKGGAEVFDGWFNSGDAQAYVNNDWLVFSDQFQNIDGAGGAGQYTVVAQAYDADSALYTPYLYSFTVGQVFDYNSNSVTVGTNNDKTGYSLSQGFPSNFSSLAITAGGAVTAGTVGDKTGYTLTQSFPTNFASLSITGAGAMTAGTVSDKTGYSLTQTFPTNFSSFAITAGGAVTAGTVTDKTDYSLSTTSLAAITAYIDSLAMLAEVYPGMVIKTKLAADVDTVIGLSSDRADTLFFKVFVHPGDSAGTPPDTTFINAGPDW